MYVELKDILIEGLVRFRTMEDDFYNYDERRLIVIGKRRKKTYKAGQKVKVKVINASLETKKIDLAIV
jgi:ribonuclease R